ncbi:MAG TPA: hypothetical protein VMW87_04065 [Spirochaetia bacterium]|nr:hypothetical protein [Spirochaetia bacterium]
MTHFRFSLAVCLVQAVFFTGVSVAAATEIRTAVSFGADWTLGSVEYDLKSESGGNGVQSRLDFPVDGLYPAITVTVGGYENGRPAWSLAATATGNILGPYGAMVDQDWNLVAGYPPVLYSYTESSSSLRELRGRLTYTSYPFHPLPADIGLRFGYEFESLYQRMDGVTGWQYQYNNGTSSYDRVTFSITGTVGTYQLYLHTLIAGLAYRFELHPQLSFTLTGDGLVILAFDDDDHILRTKRSTASAAGGGYRVAADLRFAPGADRSSRGFSVNLAGSIEGFSLFGLQTQTWYGNADASNGAPQGTVYTGIYHHISGFRCRVALYGEYAF